MIHSLLDHLSDLLDHTKYGVADWAHRLGVYGRESGHWLNRNRTDLLHILTTVIVALLLIGAINQQNASRHAADSNNQLIRGETTIIKNQSKQIDVQKAEISALSEHVDCLFALATNPNHSAAYIANPANCIIVAPAATSNSSVTPAQVSQTSLKTNSGQTDATTQNQGNGQGTPPAQRCAVKLLSFCL